MGTGGGGGQQCSMSAGLWMPTWSQGSALLLHPQLFPMRTSASKHHPAGLPLRPTNSAALTQHTHRYTHTPQALGTHGIFGPGNAAAQSPRPGPPSGAGPAARAAQTPAWPTGSSAGTHSLPGGKGGGGTPQTQAAGGWQVRVQGNGAPCASTRRGAGGWMLEGAAAAGAGLSYEGQSLHQQQHQGSQLWKQQPADCPTPSCR
jgi:hypothetical protein